ncbi:hypothetical protein B296_00005499 [Ensete ventricosum]|uniref:tRNA (guanine(46)-N(7))-methyltransferase n=1 Tax=Ensete ventricosum TaxID=4639 RepID=A0A427B9N0_ENSVE|nr:hypothetical protein B296_00005499 [Ensete ventricosum]
MLVFGCTGSRWGAAHALLGSTASAVVSSPFLRIAPTLHLRRRCRRFWCEEPKEGTANGWTRRRLTSAAQRSPDVVDMEYADLNLKNFYGAAPNCPDPHFKKRHHKRRVVQASLVDSISKRLSIGGQVFVQSDVLELALDMRNQFDARFDVFEHVDTIDNIFVCDTQGWVLHNPMGIRTEREIHAELEGARIYRRIYQKQKHYV